MKFIHSFFVITSLIVCAQNNLSQEIRNVHFEQLGNKIIIYYDLLESNSSQRFDVSIYCDKGNKDNWGNPLKEVSGEVGEDILPGLNKVIRWNVLDEFDKLVGEISFKVEAETMTGFYGKSGIFIDQRDQHKYKWVRIGDFVWMGDNLDFDIEGSLANDYQGCGRFYTYETALKACPDGWHLPSDKEWKVLELELGMNRTDINSTGNRISGNVGAKIKGNVDFINSFCGYIEENEVKLNDIGIAYWSSTLAEHTSKSAFYRLINNLSDGIVRYSIFIDNHMLNVRCVTEDN